MNPALRSGIKIVRVGPERFLLVDPSGDQRFEIGVEERYLSELLDGTRTSDQIRDAFAERFGGRLSRRKLREFCEQLRVCHLIADSDGVETVSPSKSNAPARTGARGSLRHSNRPASAAAKAQPSATPHDHATAAAPAGTDALNRRFDRLTLLLGWLVHPFWLLPLAVITIVAIAGLAPRIDRYLHEIYRLPRTYPLIPLISISLLQTLVFMNIPREVMIGVACRKLGVRVQRFGLRFIGRILPHFQCDPAPQVLFASRRTRWALLSIGLLTQLAIAAISAIGWLAVPPDTGIRVFWLILIPPCVVTIAVRLNVFATYEGYGILCQLLRTLRLRERALAETRAWLTFSTPPEPHSARERFWLRAYGLGIQTWVIGIRLLVIIGGGWWLTQRLGAAGAAITVALVLWANAPKIGRLVMHASLFSSAGPARRAWLRWTVRLILLAGVIACGFIPYDYEIGGTCRLVPAAQRGVRAQIADEIADISIREGDWVEAGATIATLAAREERASVEMTRAELAHADAYLDLLRAGPRPEEIAVASQKVEIWRIQVDFYQSEVNRLERIAGQDAASAVEVEQKRKSRDEAERGLTASQEDLARIKQGAREQEIRMAEADVQRLRAQLAHHEEMLSLAAITAPIAGFVVTPNLQERIGQMVQPGDLIAVIQDTRTLHAEVAADETAAAHVMAGMTVKLRLPGLDGVLVAGRVRNVCPVAVDPEVYTVDSVRTDREVQLQQSRSRELRAETRYVPVEVALDDAPEHLLPGMTGYARIVVSEDRVAHVVWRSLRRFARVSIWSWLP